MSVAFDRKVKVSTFLTGLCKLLRRAELYKNKTVEGSGNMSIISCSY